MSYVYWLAALAVVFVVLERFFPRYRYPIWRKYALTDVMYIVFNGHFLGVLLAMASMPVITQLNAWLKGMGWFSTFYLSLASSWPFIVQWIVALVLIDFIHWSIHNMLHRVPALWELHKVHHSIEVMDWAGSLRFHWSEGIIYKTLTYPFLALLGFQGSVLFSLAVFSTAMGFFNHANMRISVGPLKYIFNHPAMHIWHHTHPDSGPTLCNFGINLSVWDWIFGTAYIPEHPPEHLAFEEMDSFPKTFVGQVVYPIPLERWLKGRFRSTSEDEKNKDEKKDL